MELIPLLFAASCLLGIFSGYAFLVAKLNGLCKERYQYTPITFGKSCLMLIPILLMGIALFAMYEPEKVANAKLTALTSLAAAGLILLLVHWRISRQTSARIAVLTMIALLINATLVLGAIGVYIFVRMLRSESQHSRQY